MTDQEWEEMPTNEKLNWLRLHVEGLMSFGNQLGSQISRIARRLGEAEAALEDIEEAPHQGVAP